MAERFQFVWWGFGHTRWRFLRFQYGLAFIYRWSLSLGPLEIRRWENSGIPGDEK